MPVGLCAEYLRLFVAKSREDRKGDLSLPARLTMVAAHQTATGVNLTKSA